MDKRRILIFPKLLQPLLDRLYDLLPEAEWEMIRVDKETDWQSVIPGAEIVLGWRNEAADMALTHESKLKWVHNWGAGVNQIPIDRFAEHGVWLTDSSGVHPYPISEVIFGYMLMWSRQLHQYVRNQERKEWQANPKSLSEIHETTIGILGVGEIGEETARLAKAFRMQVLGLRRSGEPSPWVDRMYRPADLDEMLSQCDYVVNTLPLTDETRHWIDKGRLDTMKEGAFYINIGRGGTTDSEALLAALREGRLAGAALDVFEQEPLPADHPFWTMDNVIMTPHCAGVTPNYNERVIDIVVENLKSYLSGQPPVRNLVDYRKKY